MSVINEMAPTFGNGRFGVAKGRLQGDPVRLAVFYGTDSTSSILFDDSFRFSSPPVCRTRGWLRSALPRLIPHPSFCHGVGQFFAAARGASIDSDDAAMVDVPLR